MPKDITDGYESLKAAVERDCNDKDHCGCFSPEGCKAERHSVSGKRCFHGYCDKFEWIISRAKHYAEKTGIAWETILTSWENDREYWYMNYYQDCNQPLIGDGAVQIFETIEDFRKSLNSKGFRCPSCGKVTDDAQSCKDCGWKAYGLFGTMGKGVYIVIKGSALKVHNIFKPVSWEEPNADHS